MGLGIKEKNKTTFIKTLEKDLKKEKVKGEIILSFLHSLIL